MKRLVREAAAYVVSMRYFFGDHRVHQKVPSHKASAFFFFPVLKSTVIGSLTLSSDVL